MIRFTKESVYNSTFKIILNYLEKTPFICKQLRNRDSICHPKGNGQKNTKSQFHFLAIINSGKSRDELFAFGIFVKFILGFDELEFNDFEVDEF